jgi:hypothetical protein
VEEDNPLGGEDPVGAIGERAGSGRVLLATRNPVRAGLVETLLGGGLVVGGDAVALLSGWTPSGLVNRFEGSGLSVRVEPASPEPLPRAVRQVIDARHTADLPTDEAALSASGWNLTVGPAGS